MPPAVVLLHGFTQTGRSWAPVAAALGERYRALAPDLRGHGEAAGRRAVGFPECVTDVLGAAPARFVLAGYSMGGRIALHVALAAPERVERLVLIAATAGIEDDAERAARRTADLTLADEIERDGLAAFVERWGAQPLFAGQSDAVAAAAEADRLRNTAAGLAAALRGVGTGAMAPLWDRLAALAVPTVVAAGERDPKFRAIARRMAALLPEAAEAVVIPGAGHAAHLEQPEAVADLIATASGEQL